MPIVSTRLESVLTDAPLSGIRIDTTNMILSVHLHLLAFYDEYAKYYKPTRLFGQVLTNPNDSQYYKNMGRGDV